MARALPSLSMIQNIGTISCLLLAALLCSISYFVGSYQNSKSFYKNDPDRNPNCLGRNLSTTRNQLAVLDFEPHHSASPDLIPDIDLKPIEFCPLNFTNSCPCQDPVRGRRFHSHQLLHRERHCPAADERLRCLIPSPAGYRAPFPWPKSREQVWFANVPFKRLTESKKNQNWVRLEGDRLVFPGGGTSFPQGVKGYVDDIAEIVPFKTGEVRTVLDIGCGVASFGAQLMDFNILTMSVAPVDVHEAQVQFALERGLPAMLGVLGTYRLPYPSRSFDMSHCSRCLVRWTSYDGLYLMEIDRVLRPGGYWVLSGPPIDWRHNYQGWERKPQDLEEEQTTLENIAKRLCWKKVAERGPIAVWEKPTNHLHCMKKSKILRASFCTGKDPDSAWYTKMEACITPLPKVNDLNEVSGGGLQKWPPRLNTSPPRIKNQRVDGATVTIFDDDNKIWNKRVSHYESFLSSLSEGKYRNVMDMNAGFGGFAAAMSKYPVWVMNVIPFDTKNDTLGVIYERGLIGTYMNWCEAFSTYPRTYDLIHSSGLLRMYMDRCEILDIFIEMDRILRPGGAAIIRDHVDYITKAKHVADRIRWKSMVSHSEQGPFDPEKILYVEKYINPNSK